MRIQQVFANTLIAVCVMAICTSAAFAETVRIGLINTYSGPMASGGDQIDKAINLFMKQGACKLPPGVDLEIIKRDDTGINPETAKRLAQELIVRDKVRMLTGVIWTPNAAAIAPLTTQAKVPFVIMNAGTAMLTTLSPYIVRTSFTLWQSSYPMGQWAAKRFKRAYVAVADFGPGHDAQEAFTRGFTTAGGKVIGPCAYRLRPWISLRSSSASRTRNPTRCSYSSRAASPPLR